MAEKKRRCVKLFCGEEMKPEFKIGQLVYWVRVGHDGWPTMSSFRVGAVCTTSTKEDVRYCYGEHPAACFPPTDLYESKSKAENVYAAMLQDHLLEAERRQMELRYMSL